MAIDGPVTIFIGYDKREIASFAVARFSARRHLTQPINVHGLVLDRVRSMGLYTRPTEYRDGPGGTQILWDVISNAAMSTEHACARFTIPFLVRTGWVLFCDADILVRGSLARLFEAIDDSKPVFCVKHAEMPTASGVKMNGQPQQPYPRKLWSSVFAMNVRHPKNQALTLEMVNSLPGRDLHRFCWIENDDDIGELGPEWNHLVGISPSPKIAPRIVHFTLGTPDMKGFENCEYSDEWRAELARWVA